MPCGEKQGINVCLFYLLVAYLRGATGSGVLIHSKAETKYHRLSGLQTTEMNLHTFKGLEVQDQGVARFRVWLEPTLPVLQAVRFLPCPHTLEKGRESLCSLLYEY